MAKDKERKTLREMLERLDDIKFLSDLSHNGIYHDSIENLLSLKIDEIRNNVHKVNLALMSMSELNFSVRLPFNEEEETALTYFSGTINFLAEELEAKVIPFQNVIIEEMPELIITTSPIGYISYINPAVEKALHFKKSELVKLDIRKLFEENVLKLQLQRGFILQNDESRVNLLTKDQQKVAAHMTIKEVTDSDGVPQGFIFKARLLDE